MKTETFTIEKDFGNKTLANVFVKQNAEQDCQQRNSLEELLYSAEEFICVVAEDAFSSELMELLYNIRKQKGIRIYALVRNLEPAAFERLKNSCIIRTVPDISGNYLICDRTAAFFFDVQLHGYALKNAETVKKLHDVFIYEFWNNAKNEFIDKKIEVADQTFDVSPVQGNEQMIIDRSALSEKPYEAILQHATDFALANHRAISETIKTSSAKVYLDKKGCEINRSYIEKQDGEFIYSDSCCVPLCKSNGKWYLSNSSFDKTSNNDGKLFFIEMENEPVFSNAYRLERTYTYRNAVGKDLLALKDFSAVKIAESDKEQKSFDCDYKEFKKIKKMNKADRAAEFSNRHLLNSDKPAATISFSVEMSVSTCSKEAGPAPIYESYKQFREQRNKEVYSIKKSKNEREDNIKKCENDLNKIDSNIKDLKIKQEDFNKKINSCIETFKSAEKEKSKSDAAKYEKQRNEYIKQLDELKRQVSNLEKQKVSVTEKIKKNKSDIEDFEKKLSDVDTLEINPKTVADCKKISAVLENCEEYIPDFDEPKFGTLYKVKNGYEYELRSGDDYDEAETEMQAASLENVRFVASYK